MALYKYFKKQEGPLPNPEGPLSSKIPSSSIRAANQEVKPLLVPDQAVGKTQKRGQYKKYTAQEKAKVAKRAAECGVTNSIRHFASEFSTRPLNEGTVRVWVKHYKKELSVRKRGNKSMDVEALESKKRGRPLLLGTELDSRVQEYVKALREFGAVINTRIVMAAAEGIVKNFDCNLLLSNGGHIICGKHWAKNFLTRMGFVKRRANTTAKVSVADFEVHKAQFLFDIAAIVEMEEIPKALVINWDHTGIKYVPVSNWTMAKEGSKRVEIVGGDDKRQITAVFGCTMEGEFLPPQIIYGGKTPRCLPSSKFPDSWDITFSHNHWANEKTTESYLEKILFPFVQQKRSALGLDSKHPVLVIFDRFKGQCTQGILSMLDKNNVVFAIVPANCTDRLQPLDVSVNKAAKECLRRQFQQWYSEKVCVQLESKTAAQSVDLAMSVVKPLSVKWMIGVYDYMHTHPEIIKNGFKEAGILQ